jgi:hypothetical protein
MYIFLKKALLPVKYVLLVFFFLGWSHALLAQNKTVADESFAFESYYKIKWGYAQEFINLWMANHYPLQKKAMEKGDIISITAEKPMVHSGEYTGWYFKVTIF